MTLRFFKLALLVSLWPGVLGAASFSATNPPAVQMLVPGFTVRELPLSLPNINDIKYRPDGKVVALGYNGQVYLLSDTDGDGLEDKAELFWTNSTILAPIGMALTPPGYARGQGLFIASKGKTSLVVDTNGDDKADEEIIVATGWKQIWHGVDALGVAVDKENNIFFGLGAANYTDAYLIDKTNGQSAYSLKSERGTILKVSPDFKHREIVCTGIRFPVAMAFTKDGDLFCTDQEGATWLPNGNPLDELLYIQQGRHYGFPPRHPKHLPNVIDEPSVFDYAPQHESTCGLNFDEPVNGGPVFGPAAWEGDAIVTGYSRGKIWRTSLVKTAAGYVAKSQLIACLTNMTVDACVSPQGDLLVSTHSGEPDWGTGPTGIGRLFKISFTQKETPQPVLAWHGGPSEIRIAFDRPLDPASLKGLAKQAQITQGKYVTAGDRFEVKRPGYAVVQNQLATPRYNVPVESASFTPDQRTLILNTTPLDAAVNYGITLPLLTAGAASAFPQMDLASDLNGLAVEWKTKKVEWSGWLPHVDLAVSEKFTTGSAEHDRLWADLKKRGTLTLRGQLNLWEMLQPAVQPGSKLDYERPLENVTGVFSATVPFAVEFNGQTKKSNGDKPISFTHQSQEQWLPFEVSLTTGKKSPQLTVTYFTADDPRPRALALRRFFVPWARAKAESSPAADPQLAGGNWLRGKKIFFGEKVACYKCHSVAGEGSQVGPDLSNLVHRDYASVFKDISQPSAALNPDHLAYRVELLDGDDVLGVLQTDAGDEVVLANASGRTVVPKSKIKFIKPTGLSLMPEGLDKALSAAEMKDLMTFLLSPRLEPAPIEAPHEPPPRKRAEVEAILKTSTVKSAKVSLFHILLCAGPKDHGPGEHDYPLWQKRWSQLLLLAEGVSVDTAWEWPSARQWTNANVIIFYSNLPGWETEAHARGLDKFLARGGGAVFLHYAVDGHTNVEALAQRIGLAWRGGASAFRHGALDLKLEPSPITAGLPNPTHFVDESYWNLIGDTNNIHLLASGEEGGKPRPLIWTREQGKGRVFVSIPGHFSWTFDDPLFRILLLRGICWAGGQPTDRLSELVWPGARVPD